MYYYSIGKTLSCKLYETLSKNHENAAKTKITCLINCLTMTMII